MQIETEKKIQVAEDRSYHPDRWVILKMTRGDEVNRRVLGGWYGGYGGGDSWRLSSGIVDEQIMGDEVKITNHSGSVYYCHRDAYGLSGYMQQMLTQWQNGSKTSTPPITIEVEDQHPDNNV